MIWKVILVAAGLVFLASPADAGKEKCCCCNGLKGGLNEPPALFATGCYTGTNTDDRPIASGIKLSQAGFLRICEKTAESGNNNDCVWYIPEMGANNSCTFGNIDFDPGAGFSSCTNNLTSLIKSVEEQYFVIGNGTAAPVNASGRPFCWEQWTIAPEFHGTFTYTGDGTGDKHIELGIQPDVVVLKELNLASSNSNIARIRTADMPANTSYYVSQFASTGDTTSIRNFNATGFEAGGANGNQNGLTYYGAWWKEKAGALNAGVYTGDGDSLGSGLCGSTADTQTIASGCNPIRDAWITTVGFLGEIPGSCGLTRNPPCSHWRSDAVGLNVTGAGNLSGSDLYAFKAIQPNNSGPGIIGNFSDDEFVVTGGPNLVSSCNDLNVPYYFMATCAPAANPAQANLPDWSPFMQVVYHMSRDERTNEFQPDIPYLPTNNFCAPNFGGGTNACPETGGVCDCNMSEAGDVVRNTTDKIFGVMSAGFEDSGDSFSATLADAAVINLAGDVSFGIRHRPTTDSTANIVVVGSTTQSYGIGRNATNDTAICTGVNTGGTPTNQSVNAGGTVNQWNTTICLFNDTADTLTTVANATAPSVGNLTSLRSGVGDVVIGGTSWTGQVQEFWVYDGVLATADWCRICACGVDGSLCSCLATELTTYVSQGRLASCPTTCAINMPVCNKPAPS